jgi:hypothetical protein
MRLLSRGPTVLSVQLLLAPDRLAQFYPMSRRRKPPPTAKAPATRASGIILSRLMRDKDALPRQILLYRELVRAVFLGC